MVKMIGVSLIHCIKDVVEGRVALDEVGAIVSGTKLQNAAVWEDFHSTELAAAINRRDADWARAILTELRRSGRLIQMRLIDPDARVRASMIGWYDPETMELVRPCGSK
jgi:hypothetical protein